MKKFKELMEEVRFKQCKQNESSFNEKEIKKNIYILTSISEPKNYNIIITINEDIKFRVVLDPANLYWGLLPGNKKKIKSPGIMKVLIPAIKISINTLLTRYNPDYLTIDAKTKKGQKLYKSWTGLHNNYNTTIIKRGILLIRKGYKPEKHKADYMKSLQDEKMGQMKTFKDIYEAVMGVQQRKKAARRMAKMGKSKIVQAKRVIGRCG